MTRDCHPDPHDEHICISHGNAWWPTGRECCNEAQREMDEAAEEMRRQDRETTKNLKHLIQAMRGVQ